VIEGGYPVVDKINLLCPRNRSLLFVVFKFLKMETSCDETTGVATSLYNLLGQDSTTTLRSRPPRLERTCLRVEALWNLSRGSCTM
ncbi:unnamed protein product, partial [Ectocarpus sp. 12 AP-2014]